jgi:hypothetical protein
MLEITDEERQMMMDRLRVSLDEYPLVKEFIMGK